MDTLAILKEGRETRVFFPEPVLGSELKRLTIKKSSTHASMAC
jgi:hypothetical protein